MDRQKPTYYADVHREARLLWDLLESSKVLVAGPWWTLFRQLRKDPRHVLSELLQNADDAGATWAKASISGNHFCFEHNGRDFTREDFASLCQFGLSNKRFLHTIGFRGIGFKTTFTLGPRVELVTPTLAVAFEEDRFTEPRWFDAPACESTLVQIDIDSAEKTAVLQNHLQAWAESAIPLLFFRSIRKIEVSGTEAVKSRPAPGPISRAKRVKLSGQDLLLIASGAEPFPDDAMEEIRWERGEPELDLPPCHVEIIVGLPGRQRLYVVLPSNVALGLPFSCNAPLLQDPARTGIMSPSTSATNRWLLQRIGTLAADALREWLGSRGLDMALRAQAYEALLPEPPSEMESALGTECTEHILKVFRDRLEGKPILLTSDGQLALGEDCLGLPAELLGVWSPEQNLTQFGEDKHTILALEVSPRSRAKLAAWEWLQQVTPRRIIERLSTSRYPPRPVDPHQLATLWSLLDGFIKRVKETDGYWYWASFAADRLAVVPVRERARLFPPADVAVMGAGERDLSREDWAFLNALTPIADAVWLQELDDARRKQTMALGQAGDEYRRLLQSAGQLLNELKLTGRTGLAPVVALAAKQVFRRDDPGEDGIRLAFIAARSDVRIPDDFHFLCDDGEWRPVTDGLLADVDMALDYLPLDWVATRVLHTRYDRVVDARDRDLWSRWVGSANSRLRRFPLPEAVVDSRYWWQKRVKEFAESRGGHAPPSYRLQRDNFRLDDYDFPAGLWTRWEDMAREDPLVWGNVAMGISRDWSNDWRQFSSASIRQLGNVYNYPVDHGRLAAAWLHRLQSLACLPDQHGQLHVPAELYRTIAETAHLQDIEPFLDRAYDKPDFREFLDLLGVRSKPQSADRIVERIRALSASDTPPLEALRALYRALDRSLGHLSTAAVEGVRGAFSTEALIVSEEGTWHPASMVFQRNDEGIPGIPCVLQDLASLQLWNRLGVPSRPTIDAMIAWLDGLPAEGRLSAKNVTRLRSLLARTPQRVWEELGLWLDRDDRWTSVENLRWKTADVGATRELFPAVRQATADLSMLPSGLIDQPPFHQLTSIAAALEHRLVGSVPSGLAYQPRWVEPLATSLARIKRLSTPSSDGSTDLIGEVREQAVRLKYTRVQAVSRLSVRPYIDGQPAGEARSPQVLWHDRALYVRQDGPRIYRQLVDEIGTSFEHRDVRRAIADCVERDAQWIETYFEAQFELEPEPQWGTAPPEPPEAPTPVPPPPPGPSTETPPAPILPVDPPLPPVQPVEPPTPPKSPVEPTSPPGPTLQDRFAQLLTGKGFRYDPVRKDIRDGAGNSIRREKEMFQWVQVDGGGEVVCYYWIGPKSLRDGVEVPAEVWEMLKQMPEQVVLVLPHVDGRLHEYSGSKLLGWVDAGKLDLFPARYRLRMVEPD